MTSQMIIRIDDNIKDNFQKTAQRQGKTASEVIRELMQTYIQERDTSAFIDTLWSKIGKDLSSKNVTITDIKKAIKKSRAAKS